MNEFPSYHIVPLSMPFSLAYVDCAIRECHLMALKRMVFLTIFAYLLCLKMRGHCARTEPLWSTE